MNWGRRLLVFGIVMALAAAAPTAIVLAFPGLQEGFFAVLSVLLLLGVMPLGLVIASVGAILLLVAALKRARP